MLAKEKSFGGKGHERAQGRGDACEHQQEKAGRYPGAQHPLQGQTRVCPALGLLKGAPGGLGPVHEHHRTERQNDQHGASQFDGGTRPRRQAAAENLQAHVRARGVGVAERGHRQREESGGGRLAERQIASQARPAQDRLEAGEDHHQGNPGPRRCDADLAGGLLQDQGGPVHRIDNNGHGSGYRGLDRRRRAGRTDARHRSRPERRALHADRAQGSAAIPPQDGALQRPHDGNLPAHGARREDPRCRAGPQRADGCLRDPGDEPAAAAAPAVSIGSRGAARDRRLHRRLDAARAVSAHFPVHPGAPAQVRGAGPARRDGALRLRIPVARAGRDRRNGAGPVASLRAAYLVGCDGGASRVRNELGIGLRGEGNLLQLRQALYCCDDLYERIPIGNGPGKGRHYHVADDSATLLIMQDSTRHWTLHAIVGEDADMARQFERTVGVPVKYDMLYVGEWKQNLLLADHYGKGRVFLAGDSVHLVIPTGGLGMNTGVGDAIDLSWKLAGSLRGWGGPNLLASYELERRQIGDRNVSASRYASLGRRKWRGQYRPDIRDQTAEGQAAREHLAGVADIEQRKTNEMIGAELGYRYVGSPIISEEPGGPEYLLREYVPTTWPGARLPHVWLDGHVALQDRLGPGYTLLRLGATGEDASALQRSFAAYGAPFDVLDVADDAARDVYGYDLILLRPDLHIVWRGNRLPIEPDELAAMATGHL